MWNSSPLHGGAEKMSAFAHVINFFHIHTGQKKRKFHGSLSRGPYWIVIKRLSHNNQTAPHGTTHREQRETWDWPHALLFTKTSMAQPMQKEETRQTIFVPTLLKDVTTSCGWHCLALYCMDLCEHLNKCQHVLVWRSSHRPEFIISKHISDIKFYITLWSSSHNILNVIVWVPDLSHKGKIKNMDSSKGQLYSQMILMMTVPV